MKKGFSLVELLVVIGIIGLLAGIVLPNIATVRARGRDSKRIADISQLRLALEHYFNIKDKYPTDVYTDSDFQTVGVLNQVPYDPQGTNVKYEYRAYCSGVDVVGYHLGATLEQNNEQLTSDSDRSTPTAGVSVCSSGTDFDGTETPTLKTCSGATVTTGGCYDFAE